MIDDMRAYAKFDAELSKSLFDLLDELKGYSYPVDDFHVYRVIDGEWREGASSSRKEIEGPSE